jgi:hypothetical protein
MGSSSRGAVRGVEPRIAAAAAHLGRTLFADVTLQPIKSEETARAAFKKKYIEEKNTRIVGWEWRKEQS